MDIVRRLLRFARNDIIVTLAMTALVFSLAIPAQADFAHIDSITPNKFIEAYRKYFEKETSANLFKTRAEDSAAQETRQEILQYISENKLSANEEDIEKEWDLFIKTNYKDPNAFEKKLKNRYLSLDYVKNKFIENQDLTIYFNQVSTPRINKDIELRKKIFKLSKAKNISFSKEEVDKELNQLVANWGGNEAFREFLKQNDFKLTDLAFLIQTDLLRGKLSSALVNQDIENDLDDARNLKNAIKNHLYNFSLKNQPNYYFKQVFIPHSDEKAKEKITKAKSNFNNIETANGIEVFDMTYPASKDSHLYHSNIKAAILELGDDPLFVNKEISPVIKTEKGYHLVQIQRIEIVEALSYEEAYENIYDKLVENKYDDFSEMIDSYFKLTLDTQDPIPAQ